MREELLEYYERELTYLRQMGGEFARKYPRVEEITSAAKAVQLPAGATVRKVSMKADALAWSQTRFPYPHAIRLG